MHEGGLAGAIVPNQPDAFAGATEEIDPCKRMDGAETLFDAVQFDDGFSLAVHRPEDRSLAPEA